MEEGARCVRLLNCKVTIRAMMLQICIRSIIGNKHQPYKVTVYTNMHSSFPVIRQLLCILSCCLVVRTTGFTQISLPVRCPSPSGLG